ncbi:deoxyribose-phosphate aldolase [Streptomyces sp. NPDC005799]|uniref:deoxyribose-phosphate aldolase n=1 Tax=Streptomyces sp. NPDC005799 TaxID=3154678 RepID=UPI0033FDD91E
MDPTSVEVQHIAKMIDHSLLRPELTVDDMLAGCALAAHYNVASACVKPSHVSRAVKELSGTGVLVGTVVGFPHGASTTSAKVAEAAEALENGAAELDMVLNIGYLRGGDDTAVADDIHDVVRTAGGKALVKIIFENTYLTDDEKIRACRLSASAGAAYVKTSTGFASGGATLEDVRLMRAHVPAHMKVKAAGGVRTLGRLLEMVEAGAERFGATATATILDAAQRSAT